MSGPRLEVVADAEEAARRGALLIASEALQVAGSGGRFSFAASGGRDPWTMYRLLRGAELNRHWERVEVFQVDERVAPDGHDDRNLTHLREALPAAARAQIRPMPVTEPDLDAAAARYDAELPGGLDLVHLGLGPDGHTASLVPGDPLLDVRDRRVAVTGEYKGRRRMTLTYPALEQARKAFWLVTGESKRDALARLLDGDHSIPAGRVRAAELLVIADRAAAQGL